MNFKEITLENISNYITGNIAWLGAKFNLISKAKQEQVIWRATQCPPECAKNNECSYCGCDYPQKLYNKESCNKGRNLPDLMDEELWEQYKQKLKSEKTTKLPKTSN